jgi:hypothetical protein
MQKLYFHILWFIEKLYFHWTPGGIHHAIYMIGAIDLYHVIK